MGNSSSKDSSSSHRGSSNRTAIEVYQQDQHPQNAHQQPPSDRVISIYGPGSSASRRGSRHEIPFLHLSRDRTSEQTAAYRPKETRQEKEARRAERERQARLKERERSLREEHVDGGFLVTLGTYTGPEDFSKPVVRQLQIERRLAPFWRGLNDHSDSWTEHQLVAAVRNLPIPAADEIPESLMRPDSQGSEVAAQDTLSHGLDLPATSRPSAGQHVQLSASQPISTSMLLPLSPLGTSPLFRGRAKTLATLAGGSRTGAPDLIPQEIQLPNDPSVNGLPIEAYLYREPSECPICFLYYPPYLNKTRCCDQPICSECFVQIKRPDPHLPEHEQPDQPRRPEEHPELLVSEIASCPFCVAPEFGITYQPPPFRRGLIYANQGGLSAAIRQSPSASHGSLPAGARRRTISISAAAPEVVSTDMVRPDWAKKLADARAHALRRSAAATALHNAAYVLGAPESGFRSMYGRRRRSLFVDNTAGSSSNSQQADDDGGADLFPGRTSSRRPRAEDLEELMMMEAIRLSLAAEEERKRKEDKDKVKEEKKKAKEAKREAKQLEKLSKKGGGSSSSIYKMQSNDSTSTWASSGMARSSSNLGSQPMIPEESVEGKGKAPVQSDSATASNSFGESESTAATSGPTADAQRHLTESRANMQSNPITMPQRRQHLRQLSSTSSLASSLGDSTAGSLHAESPSPSPSGLDGFQGSRDGSPFRSGTPSGPAGSLEPMLNFQSLAAMIGNEGKAAHGQHLEHSHDAEKLAKAEEDLKGHSPAASPAPSVMLDSPRRNRGDSAGSSLSAHFVGKLDGSEHETTAGNVAGMESASEKHIAAE